MRSNLLGRLSEASCQTSLAKLINSLTPCTSFNVTSFEKLKGFNPSRKQNRKRKEEERKKDKKSRNRRFLRGILKNGTVGNSKNGGFIGLICF